MSNGQLWFIFWLILICTAAADAKEWRGIIPLQSTKADVEKIVGPPNSSGQYEIENGRLSVLYSDGLCDPNDQTATNCECLVPKDTVLRIYLTFDSPPTVSSLRFNKAKYRRTPFRAYEPSATYSNFTEGVVYTVRESDNRVTNIDYLPSARDCQKAIKKHAHAPKQDGRESSPGDQLAAMSKRFLANRQEVLATFTRIVQRPKELTSCTQTIPVRLITRSCLRRAI